MTLIETVAFVGAIFVFLTVFKLIARRKAKFSRTRKISDSYRENDALLRK